MHIMSAIYLDQIIKKNTFDHSSDILDQLRIMIMEVLKQTGKQDEVKNGLDISICIYDDKSKVLEYSGAHNPIYIIKEGSLVELKADRMPVGIHDNYQNPFTYQRYNLNDGDRLFLFSDGYADQFGGEFNKKFRYSRLQEVLTESSKLPINEQKLYIEKCFNDWIGNNEQVDDVLILGIQF